MRYELLDERNESRFYFIALNKTEYTVFFNIFSKLQLVNIEKNKKEALELALKTKYNVLNEEILMHGTADDNPKANLLIEKMQIYSDGRSDRDRFCYKCFSIHEWKHRYTNKNMILHEDAKSSWKCMLEHCGKPTHGIVIKTTRIYGSTK